MQYKIPSHLGRNKNETPPRKNRKALGENSEIVNSPVFAKDMMHSPQNNNQNPLLKKATLVKHEPNKMLRTSLRPSKLPTSQRMTKLTKPIAHPTFTPTIVDPNALKKQQARADQARRSLEVSKERLSSLNRKYKDMVEQFEELRDKRKEMSEEMEMLKRKIIEYEIEIDDLDQRIQTAENDLKSFVILEEKKLLAESKERIAEWEAVMNDIRKNSEEQFNESQQTHADEVKEAIAILKQEISEKDVERRKIKNEAEQELGKRRDALNKEIDQAISAEDSKNKELLEHYEIKSEEINKLNDELERIQKEVKNLETEINSINDQIHREKELCITTDSKINELLKQLSVLEQQDSEIQTELMNKTLDAEKLNTQFTISQTKIEKERNLRMRIQNSIEEINGKLRTYINFTSDSPITITDDAQDVEFQTIELKNQSFKFNKIFNKQPEARIIQEIITLTEHTLKGVNTSLVSVGSKSSLIRGLVFQTLKFWEGRVETVERYSKWDFEYSFQIVSFDADNNRFLDFTNSQKLDVKYDSSKLGFDGCNTIKIDDLTSQMDRSNAETPTIINLITKRSNSKNSVISNCLILSIPQSSISDDYKQVLKNISSFNKSNNRSITPSNSQRSLSSKPSMERSTSSLASVGLSSTSNLPKLYELIQFVYMMTKSLTLFNIDLVRETDGGELLKVARGLKGIDVPVSKPAGRIK